ncbi:putative bifunctional diguanylate cyclase/phosphodiesterase [Vibrio paucivorans]
MATFSIAFIMIGIAFLVAAYIPARKICRASIQIGWKALLVLICGFIAGYTFVLISLLHSPQTSSPVLFGLSLILLSGSIFVYMVITFSLATILQLNSLAGEEKHNALHDSLTALPNRKHCIDVITSTCEVGGDFSVLMIDVVNFKQINDGMGHFCGDQMLVQIGQRINSLLEPTDFLARVGGDEFVLVHQTTNHQEIKKLCKQIDTVLRKPFSIDGFELTTSVVIGVCGSDSDATTSELFINHADLAMYYAKKSGRLSAFYNQDMSLGAKQKLEISRQIDTALEKCSFRMFYQPIMCGKNDIVEGYEALIRWVDDHGRLISPVDFIPIAEQSNKISSITAWILEQVAEDLVKFQVHDIECDIHINLSAKDLLGKSLFHHLETLVERNPQFAEHVVLEITETTAINRLRSPIEMLNDIKKLGFRISLDDFGTGYSSLSLLRDLPVDQIKIDRSFLFQLKSNHRNESIVANAISLAHGLGYTVVAEGVEDRDVLDLLKKYDCDYIQGYYYCSAKPLEEAISWTLNHNPPRIPALSQKAGGMST